MMPREEKLRLLQIARATLEDVAARGAAPPAEPGAAPPEKRGAFVSLHRGHEGAIRGCVGCMASDVELEDVVREMTAAAATRDPRFAPVTPAELAELEIEISVLDPAERVASPSQVQIGRDGLMVVGRGRRGVLLPQVAVERGWSARQFAEQTCLKAGLPPSCVWEPDTELFRFAAEVFDESLLMPS